eukprot:Gb_22469 [translate_table: standard]
MGNSVSRVVDCFMPSGNDQDRGGLVFSGPLDEGLGHSFCYVRPVIESARFSPSQSDRFGIDPEALDSESHSRSFRFSQQQDPVEDTQKPKTGIAETTFKAISGASVSANTSTPRTVVAANDHQYNSFANGTHDRAAAFESTSSFSSIPLQPLPRAIAYSGPMSGPLSGPVCNTAMDRGFMSAPLERGFMSGPLERGFLSGPLENIDRGHFSAPLGGHHHLAYFRKRKKYFSRVVRTVSKPVRKALSRTLSKTQRSWVLPAVLQLVGWQTKDEKCGTAKGSSAICDSGMCLGYPPEVEAMDSHNLQWAQGKAGEDRVHVVLSEEHGWLFVGIYDGFNGPDAPDFLMSNLYKAIFNELEGLLWDPKDDGPHSQAREISPNDRSNPETKQENPEAEDMNMNKTEEENIGEDDRQPLSTIDREKPHSEIPQMDTEGSKCSVECDSKGTGSEGNTLPLSGFIKRVTFQSEKKAGGEGRRGRPLRELLAEEEDDSLDFFVWNPTADILDKTDQDIAQMRENPDSRNIIPTADESSSALEVSVEAREGNTREGNGASDHISGASTRRSSYSDLQQKQGRGRSLFSSKLRQAYSKRKESHRKLFPWRFDWEKERIEVEKKLDERLKQDTQKCKTGAVDHASVLKALSRALEATEEAYLEMTDKVLDENPELALMGSCLLVMLMKDQDVYVMNVGDSRAIVAQQRSDMNPTRVQQCSYQNVNEQERVCSKDSLVKLELEGITEESAVDSGPLGVNTNSMEMEMSAPGTNFIALQLSTDHSTSIEEEVLRIKAEHPDDNQSILNDRVKGRLKVTRAFGAGFLKQPKWNNALLEMFRNDYVGTAPYITCTPSLCHHRLGPNDQFVVLSSDGLYQYLSNQEVVSHVERFMEKYPDGDPAQHLIEQLLFRAAEKAGMDFLELLNIPQGDRRKYHDDVSVMVISLEGRIWKSSGKYI